MMLSNDGGIAARRATEKRIVGLWPVAGLWVEPHVADAITGMAPAAAPVVCCGASRHCGAVVVAAPTSTRLWIRTRTIRCDGDGNQNATATRRLLSGARQACRVPLPAAAYNAHSRPCQPPRLGDRRIQRADQSRTGRASTHNQHDNRAAPTTSAMSATLTLELRLQTFFDSRTVWLEQLTNGVEPDLVSALGRPTKRTW